MSSEVGQTTQVLVVEDDPLELSTLELLLGDRWPVLSAASAAEARAVMRREPVAVLLTDQRMPGETGVELLSWAVERYPETMRLLLTGHTDAATAIEAINRGKIWHLVQKPWDNHDLLSLIQRAQEHRERALEATRRYEGAIRSLVVALEQSHPYSSGHSQRVAGYSGLLCDALGLDGREREQVVLAAQLHDLGKIGVDKHYLDKTGPLTDQEQASVQQHVAIGRYILEETGFLQAIVPLAAAHHERLDGSGYPQGLRAEQIPLGGRIIAVADSYDAMTSARAYREPLPRATALEELRRGAGCQFDADLVRLFCELAPEQPAGGGQASLRTTGAAMTRGGNEPRSARQDRPS